jgi:hypothetical protein
MFSYKNVIEVMIFKPTHNFTIIDHVFYTIFYDWILVKWTLKKIDFAIIKKMTGYLEQTTWNQNINDLKHDWY